MTLQLSDTEAEMIVELLQIEQRELAVEVHRTDRLEAKGVLTRRLELIEKLTKQLQTQPKPMPA